MCGCFGKNWGALMHELALCSRIVDAAREELTEYSGEALRVYVVIGALHQIVPSFLQEAYRALTRDTVLEGTDLVLRFVPVRVQCRCCDWEGEIAPPFFSCGRCGGTSVALRTGREFYLEKLTITEKESA